MITIINIKKAAGNIFMLLLAAFSLYSCRIYSNYERPSNLPTTGLYRDTTSVTGILVSDTLNFGNTPWRQVFTDANLQALIEKALTKNILSNTLIIRNIRKLKKLKFIKCRQN